jgi:hypothetical protein
MRHIKCWSGTMIFWYLKFAEFYVGAKLGLTPQWKDRNRGCVRTKWCGEYFEAKEKKMRGLHNLYASPKVNRMMKSRRMRWTGHVARMRGIRNEFNVSVGERGRPVWRLKRGWEVVLNRRRKKEDLRLWPEVTWLSMQTADAVWWTL